MSADTISHIHSFCLTEGTGSPPPAKFLRFRSSTGGNDNGLRGMPERESV